MKNDSRIISHKKLECKFFQNQKIAPARWFFEFFSTPLLKHDFLNVYC